MKTTKKLLGFMVLSMVLAVSAMAQAGSSEGPILLCNVKVFDGVSDKLIRIDDSGLMNFNSIIICGLSKS